MANNLSFENKTLAVSMLCEGNSIRSIERMTGIRRDTIMRLGVRVGEACKTIMDDKFRGLQCNLIQVDEMWGFIGAKQKTAKANDMVGCGDIWVWVALDADTKLVPVIATGKRDKMHANAFMADLAERPISRPQISSDALKASEDAIERAFGSEVDCGTVIKTFTHTDLEATRCYSPPEVLKIEKKPSAATPTWLLFPPLMLRNKITLSGCIAADSAALRMPSARSAKTSMLQSTCTTPTTTSASGTPRSDALPLKRPESRNLSGQSPSFWRR